MEPVPLSDETLRRVHAVFPQELWQEVIDVLTRECGSNLPFFEKFNAVQLERARFSALKLSGGNMKDLMRAVEVAQQDWRDLFVAAGFGNDPEAHKSWFPEKK